MVNSRYMEGHRRLGCLELRLCRLQLLVGYRFDSGSDWQRWVGDKNTEHEQVKGHLLVSKHTLFNLYDQNRLRY